LTKKNIKNFIMLYRHNAADLNKVRKKGSDSNNALTEGKLE